MTTKKYFPIALAILFILSVIMPLNVIAADSYDNAYIGITLLNQDPDPAEPGKYVELRWTVVKSGNDVLKNITFKLEPKYPFSFDGSDEQVKVIDYWKGTSENDEYYTLYYKLKVDEDAIESTNELDLYYSTRSGSWTKNTYKIRVGKKLIPELDIGLIRSEPSKVMSDTDDNQLNIEIINTGDGTSENVIATLDLPTGFENSFGYSNKVNIGNIAAHSSKYAKVYFNVNKDVKPGTYRTTLNLKYKEDDKDEFQSIQIPIDIEVMSSPRFTIESVSFGKDKIFAGDTVDMTFKIRNDITKEIESVSVRAFKESTQPIEFVEKSDFIGTLGESETGDAIIKFDVKKDAEAKRYILDLEIRSVYNEQVFIQNEKVSFEVSSIKKEFNKDLITYLLCGIIVVLVLVIIFRKKN